MIFSADLNKLFRNELLVLGLVCLYFQPTVGGAEIRAVRGNGVWINCTFDPARMKMDNVPVSWYLTQGNGSRRVQYYENGVDHLQTRAASRRGRVYPDKFRDGNASLFIENVQMSDEGHYECVVILKDGVTSEISVLTVLASSEPPQLTEANRMRVTTGQKKYDQHIRWIFPLYSIILFIILCVAFKILQYKACQNLTRKRMRISTFSHHTVTPVLIGKPQYGVPSLINSCVFAYKAEEPFANWAGAEKDPPHYAQPEEVHLTEHITITRALLRPEDRFWTSEREAYLDKWRREAQSHRRPFVFVHSCTEMLTTVAKDEIKELFEDIKSVTGSHPFTGLTKKNQGHAEELVPFFHSLGSKRVFTFHNYTIQEHKRTAKRDEEFLDFMNACIEETDSETVRLIEDV